LTWTNGAGAVSNELYFGTNPGSLSLVQSGSLATSWTISGVTFEYGTDYFWQVVEIGDTCDTFSSVWSFTTAQDPNFGNVFTEDFDGSWAGSWTIANNGGICVWEIGANPGIYAPPSSSGNILFVDSDACGSGTTTNSTATMDMGISMVGYTNAVLGFAHDLNYLSSETCQLGYSIDGGTTWTVLETFTTDLIENWESAPGALAALDGQADVRFQFTYIAGWDWWWAIDNIYLDAVVPVELTSFAANVNDFDVTLNWSTATETNNQGFNVERNSGSGFEKIAFVAGFGTSTEVHNYTYTDNSLLAGTYTYRLKQTDYDGTFEYSDVVEVEVVAPNVFTLEQNYPNPFNPSTMINFSLAADSKVSLTVFDVLGQEVANLISGNLAAGSHEINFNASNVNSGVYFYRIDATGVDGTNFTSVKKMILTK